MSSPHIGLFGGVTCTCIYFTQNVKTQRYYPAIEISVLFIKAMLHLFSWFKEFSKFSQNSFYLTELDGNLGETVSPLSPC